MKRNIALTKNGMPALWECGGATTNTASCVIIGDKHGKRKKPVFIRTGGHLSNDNHALFILNEHDIIVVGTRTHQDYTYYILRYVGFEKGPHGAIGEFDFVNHYSEGSWDNETVLLYKDMVDAAKLKMSKYHCREAVYALGLNMVEDTLSKIKNGEMIVLDKRLSAHEDIINTYFTRNKGKEREVLKYLDLSDYSLDSVALITKYVPWQSIRNKVPTFIRDEYEKYRTTNYTYHFIIAPNTYDDDYIREMSYYGCSYEIAETRNFNELPDNKKLTHYLHRIAIYVNFINVPEKSIYSYASSDALHFTMDFGYGRKLCIYDHLSHIIGDKNRNPYSAASLIDKE